MMDQHSPGMPGAGPDQSLIRYDTTRAILPRRQLTACLSRMRDN
jgi:hypothetical protein